MADPRDERIREVAVLERRALVVSMVAAALIGAVGVVWGLTARSQMIVFDGVYALLGIGLSWMAIRAVQLVDAGPTARYPFGRESLTPLVIGVQGVALLMVCIYATIEAVATIRAGGSDVTPGWATGYAVVSVVASTVVYLWLRPRSRRSELLGAEATQWLAGSALGVGMVVGFASMWLLQDTSWQQRSRYIDPVMVIATCLVLFPTPVRMIRSTLIELLEGTPATDVQDEVSEALAYLRTTFGLDEPYVRMTKVGRKLYLEVDFVVAPSWTVGEADAVRRVLTHRLTELPHALWLNVEFTADLRYAE